MVRECNVNDGDRIMGTGSAPPSVRRGGFAHLARTSGTFLIHPGARLLPPSSESCRKRPYTFVVFIIPKLIISFSVVFVWPSEGSRERCERGGE